MTESWLIDTSALVRLPRSPDRAEWETRVERGLLRIATVTLLEVGVSARSSSVWADTLGSRLVGDMPVQYVNPAAEKRAVEVQGELCRRGHHRAVSVPDLLLAAIAERAGLTVLHVDKDFELIGEVTGQPMERLRES